jgi:hypothetical protein
VIRPEGRYRVELQRVELQRAEDQRSEVERAEAERSEHGPDGALRAETDVTGMFELRLTAHGAVRLVVSALDPDTVGEALVTTWFDQG